MTTNRELLIKRLQAEFRGILLSAGRHGVTVRELMRDYSDLNGIPIPLHELGYTDIDQLLLNDMQDVCTFWKNPLGEVTLFPISHESTRHIERLISRQRVHKATRFGSVVGQSSNSSKNRNRNNYQSSNRNYSNTRSSAVQSKPVAKPVQKPPPPAPAPPHVSRQPSTQYTAAASILPQTPKSVKNSVPTIQNTAHPIMSSVSTTKNVPRSVLMTTPVNNTMNVVPVTTVSTTSSMSLSNSAMPVSLRHQILQPRFYQPESPLMRHVPSPKLSSPTPFDDGIHVRVPTSASSTFTPARMTYSPRQSISTPVSNRPNLPNTVDRPLFNRLPSPFGQSQITTVASTTKTTTSPNPIYVDANSASFGGFPSASGFQQPIAVATIQPALNSVDNQKLPSKNKEYYLELKANINAMLEKYSRRGVDVAIFKSAYEDMYKKRVNVQELFEMNWKELLLSMDDICTISEYNIVKPRKSGENSSAQSNSSPPGYTGHSPSEVVTTKPNDVRKWLIDSTLNSAAADLNYSLTKPSFSNKIPSILDIHELVPSNFTYSLQKLPEGEEWIQVLMLQCNAPDDFNVQLKSLERELNILMANMRRINFDDETLIVLPGNLHPGMACAAWFDPGGWHRATVLSIDSRNEITCLYVDFGTIDSVPLKKVRYLPSQFKDLPAQAIKAKLAYLQPVDGKQFSKLCTERLIEHTRDKTFWIQTVPSECTENVIAVILTVTTDNADIHVNDLLLLENLAKLPFEYVFNGMNDLSCNDPDADSIICDEEFGFDDPNSSRDVFANTSPPAQSVDWEDEVEALPDDSSEISEPSVSLQCTASASVDDSWLLPELETEYTLVKRARAMVAEHKAPTDSLQIIRTVVGLRRSTLCKNLSSSDGNTSNNIVDKIDWLEEQIRWLDEQLFEPDEPS